MSSPVRTDSDHALDAQLLARVGQGDKEALGELYDRWSQHLQPLVAAAASDPAQIENALHDTFITLWQKAPDFDSHQTHAYDWAVEWIRASSTASTNATQATTTLPTDLPAPTAALRSRILNSAVPLPPEARYVLPFPTPPAWLGWVAASVFSFAALFFAAKSFNVRGELQSAIETERVTRLEAGTFKNLLEAERILSQSQLEHLRAAERLITELRAQNDLSNVSLITLTAPAEAAVNAQATVAWNPTNQSGLLVVGQLPVPPAGQTYQLWISDASSPTPSKAGVLQSDPATGFWRISFKPTTPLKAIQGFLVTRESTVDTKQPEGPVVLSGKSR